MAARWIELVTGSLEEKKQYRRCKARIQQLHANYRVAAEAVERYLIYDGGFVYTPANDGESQAGQAYKDAVARFLGEDRPMRFIEAEKRGFFSRLFGGRAA